nr:ABC transporter substrate-binding protein [uncultured Dysosmobacter sp.]
MKKKLLALILAGVMALSLAACGGTADTAPAEEPAETEEPETQEPAAQTYTIGICQLAPHPALDAATEGFQDALTEAFGENVKFDLQNAAGDTPTCSTIVNGFVSSKVDLIMANATGALQAATAATADIPVLGTSVTEYGVALGISDFSGTVGTNVSGTSDLAPLDQQAAMVQEWFPDAKTVGLLYCSAEPNSQYQVDNVQKYLEELGFTCAQYAFSDTNDMASVVQNAADNSDVLYVPTDNTCANNAGIIDNICRPAGIPVIAGEEGICGGCGVATLSISYYDLGVATGKMAVKILTGESDVSEMPIEYAPQFTKKYNPTICEDLGLTVPEGYEAISE